MNLGRGKAGFVESGTCRVGTRCKRARAGEWLLRAFAGAGKVLKRISGRKVWQDGNQPKGIETNAFLEQKLDYIHRNPVEAEMVEEPEYYLYSSARDYAGKRVC